MFHISIPPIINVNLYTITVIRRYATTNSGNIAKKLYKHLLKECHKLPKGPKEHYIFMIKQSFKQHVNESDPERIKQIIQRSYEDCEWILKKYLGK